MSDGGIIYGRQAHEQLAKTVRETSRRMMNQQPIRQRWQGHPGSCGRMRYKLYIEGNPDGGTATFNVYGGSLGSGGVDVTFDWDATAAEVQTELETETGLTWMVYEGPFPNNPIRIENLDTEIKLYAKSHTLDQNGPLVPYNRTDSCCY